MNTTILSTTVFLFAAAFTLAADAIPHPEHPRPDFRREPWVNLNGAWQFDFDAKDAGETEKWFEPGKHAFGRKITVPFPWEAKLSGIGDVEYKGVAWYAREIAAPKGPGWDGKSAWLVIGACDWEARVWINGKLAGEHVGGYVPFAVNLTQHAKPGEKAFIVIRAKDLTEGEQPTGKQINWYTRTSGLWQTVYLEPRGDNFIDRFQFTCQPNGERPGSDCPIRFETTMHAKPSPQRTTELFVNGKLVGRGGGAINAIIEKAKLWSPDSPNLYDARLVVKEAGRAIDEVHTYFGLRTVDVGKAPGGDYKYIRLNGKPIYLRGALHQSFHPDGIHQYPDDAAVRKDYELSKQFGLAFLRIHIKIPTPRELYWADKLGILIMQDMPCYWKHTEKAERWYEEMLRAAIARDFNHPSIFAWVDFNETWGIGDGGYKPERHRWVAAMWRLTKELDPTRLVEDNSPCLYDHVVTDINSWHFYINDYADAKKHIAEVVEKTFPGSQFNYVEGHKQDDAPLINSEYGGISAGLGDADISWCFKYLTNELRKHDKICGYIYTELSDIEWEHNGYANYDRSAKEYHYDFWHPGFTLKDLNNPDFIVLDAEPCVTLKPGENRSVPVAISHWSDADAKNLELRWREDWTDRFGKRHAGKWQRRPAKWQPFTVVAQDPIAFDTEKDGVLGALLVELIDGEQVLARNYLNISVPADAPRLEVLDANRIVMRFEPTDFAAWEFPKGRLPGQTGIATQKAFAAGAGFVEYRLQLPERTAAADIESIELMAELSSKAEGERLDWPARLNPNDYPQTDVKKWPSDLVIHVNGVEVQRTTLPDDPADAAGVLTHKYKYQSGSYGFMTDVTISGDTAKKVLAAAGPRRVLAIRIEVPADAKNPGGLAVFGDGLGRYAMDPTCILTFRAPHGLAADSKSAAPVVVDHVTYSTDSVVPTAENQPQAWRFTTTKPANDWSKPGFDDAQWETGKGGFGVPQTPNSIVNTEWKTKDIWLRKEFGFQNRDTMLLATIRLYHDDDAEVYLNGERVVAAKGWVTQYTDKDLSRADMERLKEGRNVLAVHCRQKTGDQNIDVGLIVTRKK